MVEPDAEAPEGAMLEYYRVDSMRRMLRALIIGPSLLAAGSVILALALVVAKHSEPGRWALVAVGSVCTVGGPIFLIASLHRILREEAYLALRTDGVLYHRGAERELLAWDTLEKVRWDPEASVLRLERRTGDPWLIAERFAGIDGPALAKRMEDVRRKASFGLLDRNA
jgi:hypothetical protein